MGDTTGIGWTDHTFNPWWGCSRVSPACRFCYADTQASRWGHQLWRRHGERRMMSDRAWGRPLVWNRDAEKAGVPAKTFCASMADVFEDHPQVTEPRKRLWDLIGRTPWLRWQLLTKRIENVAGMVPWGSSWPSNVWIGTSAENQFWAERRIEYLRRLPAAIRFVSFEPLLGTINLHARDDGLYHWLPDYGPRYSDSGGQVCQAHGMPDCRQGCAFIDWAIIGGESGGAKRREMDLHWMVTIARQCQQAGVPVFIKQDSGPKSGLQGRIPDYFWSFKEFPDLYARPRPGVGGYPLAVTP